MFEKIDELNEKYKIDGVAGFKSGPGALPVLEISNSGGQAEIALHGGHVMRFNPCGQAPVLWMSDYSCFTDGKAIRGGIPVCWPWFGAHPDGGKMPSHGFARLLEWEMLDLRKVSENLTRVRMALPESRRSKEFLIHPYSLEIVISVGVKLDVDLITSNTGDDPLRVSSALHSYFNISEISQITIHGLAGCHYLDTLKDNEKKIQEGAITFDSELDRIYLDTEDEVEIEDSGMNRSINIAKRGSRSTVVWNPWTDKSVRMMDFGEREYVNMVCVETANVQDDSVEILPGQKHLLGTTHCCKEQ